MTIDHHIQQSPALSIFAQPQDDDGMVKRHVASVHISNNISCLQRKTWSFLLYKAFPSLLETDIHRIKISEIAAIAGYNSNDIHTLKASLVGLASTQIQWHMLDERGKKEWGVSAMLASAEIKDGGICEYTFSAPLRKKLFRPDFYTKLPLSVIRSLSSSFSLAVYENCARFKRIGQTPWFDLDVFRKLVGAEGRLYDEFKFINQRVIQPSIKEINTLSDIRIALEVRRAGRAVFAVKFTISPVDQSRLPIESAPKFTFDEDLLEILQSDFCLTPVAAKEILVKYADERIRAVIEYVAERFHLGKVKQEKIAPYFLSILEKDVEIFNKKSRLAEKTINKYEEKARKDQASKAAEDAALKALKQSNREVSDYIKSLQPAERVAIEDAFAKHLDANNKMIAQFFRRSGFQNPSVVTEFKAFQKLKGGIQ